MARSFFSRVSVLVIAASATLGLAGCVGGSGSPSPTATSSSSPTKGSTPTPTPTPSKSASPTPSPTASPTPKPISSVSVQILNASYDPSTSSISVAGMVTDLVSQSGVCVVTATQDGQSATAQAPGMADAAVTYCSNLSIALPAGSSGTWDIELSFADETHAGVTSGTVAVG